MVLAKTIGTYQYDFLGLTPPPRPSWRDTQGTASHRHGQFCSTYSRRACIAAPGCDWRDDLQIPSCRAPKSVCLSSRMILLSPGSYRYCDYLGCSTPNSDRFAPERFRCIRLGTSRRYRPVSAHTLTAVHLHSCSPQTLTVTHALTAPLCGYHHRCRCCNLLTARIALPTTSLSIARSPMFAQRVRDAHRGEPWPLGGDLFQSSGRAVACNRRDPGNP